MLGLFSKPLPVGSPAPPFILPDQEGRVFVLNMHRNKRVVLVFYPADHTPTCTKQLCEMRDEWERITHKGGYVVGINPGDEASHRSFKEKLQLPFPLLVDYEKRVASLYRCGGLIVKRTVYVVGRDGNIAYARRGKPAVGEVLTAIAEPAEPQS